MIQIKVPTITHIVDRYIPDINIINPMKKKTDHLFRINHLLLKSYHKKRYQRGIGSYLKKAYYTKAPVSLITFLS